MKTGRVIQGKRFRSSTAQHSRDRKKGAATNKRLQFKSDTGGQLKLYSIYANDQFLLVERKNK